MRTVRIITMVLVIIGAINWGLWGFFQYDLIADLFGGPSSGLARLIYALIGLAGLYAISLCCCCARCATCNAPGHGKRKRR